MSPALSVATSLSPNIRRAIGIQMLARTEPISQLSAKRQVSRKFIYQQGDKAQRSLDESFAASNDVAAVLFHLLPPARDQKLSVPADSGLGTHLSQLISRCRRAAARSVRYADQHGYSQQ